MSEETRLKVYLETSFWSFLNGRPRKCEKFQDRRHLAEE